MRFGKTLRDSIYPPWRGQYIDYPKLKQLLREDSADDDTPWTEEDEQKFSHEILNVELEKVAEFQAATFKSLEQRANRCHERLQELAPKDGEQKNDDAAGKFKEIEAELDSITNEAKELKKYSSINYTGFLKIVKKHDRKRGSKYKLRPMLQISLTKRPFNSEQGYSPLLNKLSVMYFVVGENGAQHATTGLTPANQEGGEQYTAHKCK
jgi:SPX domain protein involved in polyphosphate accumulation